MTLRRWTDTLVDTYEGEALDVETGFPYVGVNGTVEGGSRNGTVEGYSLVNYHFYPYYLMPISSATTKLQGPTPTITSPAVTPNFVPYVFSENYGTTDIATNVYDIVFVNEAFADSNITVEVQFSDAYENTLLENPDYLGNEFQFEPMIKFSAPVLDALTGQIVSNSIYLLDTAGIQQPAVFSTNSLYAYSPRRAMPNRSLLKSPLINPWNGPTPRPSPRTTIFWTPKPRSMRPASSRTKRRR